MNTAHRFRSLLFSVSLGALFALTGCVVDNETKNPDIVDPVEETPCTESVLCRLQNPADTIGLDAAQKAEIESWFLIMEDSTIFALTNIHSDSLRADTIRFALLNDIKVKINSILFEVTDSTSSDSVTVVDWRGSVAAPHQGFVDLTFKNNVYESGFAVIDGEYISMIPLGGSKALVAYLPNSIWMGECPGMKHASTALTCANPLP